MEVSEKSQKTNVFLFVLVGLLFLSLILNIYFVFGNLILSSLNPSTGSEKEESEVSSDGKTSEEFPDIGGDGEFRGFVYNPNEIDAVIMFTGTASTSRIKYSSEVIRSGS